MYTVYHAFFGGNYNSSHPALPRNTGKETHGDSGEIIGFNGSQARLPRYIFLVRHGESEGNLDPLKYRTTADNCIELTEKGHNQALDAGNRIAEFLKEKGVAGGGTQGVEAEMDLCTHGGVQQTEHLEQTGSDKPIPVFFYYSPYERSKQTTCGLMYGTCSGSLSLSREADAGLSGKRHRYMRRGGQEY
eukprot:gene2063-2759_t